MSRPLPSLNPKRLRSDAGIDSWYPYYAGFSSSFASGVLQQLPLSRRTVVADPWVGSGTTTSAAALLGCRAVGFDLNPFAIVVATAKLVSRDSERHLLKLATRVLEARDAEVEADDPLNAWLSGRAARKTRAMAAEILATLGVSPGWQTLPAEAAFLLLCLVRAVRDVAAAPHKTNPTWRTPSVRVDAKADEIEDRFLRWVRTLAAEAVASKGCSSLCDLRVADSRDLPLADDSVDIVVGSPCQAIVKLAPKRS